MQNKTPQKSNKFKDKMPDKSGMFNKDHEKTIFSDFKGKKFNKSKGKSSIHEMKEILSDPRFAHVASDPRYRNASTKEIKVHLDNRFKAALTDENFSTKPHMDPRGRPKSYGTKEKLDKFYDLPSSENESDEEVEEEQSDEDGLDSGKEKGHAKVSDQIEHNVKTEAKSESISKELKSEKIREKLVQCLFDPDRDLARGETFYSDDSSDDDSTTTDEDEEEETLKEFEWGELDGDAQWDCDGTEVEETNRFAVCNMDWDRIKAVDLMVLFSSFVPSAGVLKKVTVYPSEYGKNRLKEEEMLGPQELVRLAAGKKIGRNDDFEDLEKIEKGTLDESTAASSRQLEALRRYQRNRLRYFYAVVECDSVETARIIYRECDRTHYEMAGVTLDLRYIPREIEFDEVPHDECEKVPDMYESESFQTTALLDAKPTLTWDETDWRRKKTLSTAMKKALKKESFDEEVLKDYVACSDDEDDEEEEEEEDEVEEEEKKEERIAKFRALISEIDEKEKKKQESRIDVEDTFDLEERNGESERENEESEESSKSEENLTPFEKFLVKRKEKKKKKKMNANDKEIGSKNEGEIESKESDLNDTIKEDKFPHINFPDLDSNISPKNKKSKKKERNKSKKSLQSSSMDNDNDLSLLVMDEEEEEKKHFDMRKINEEKKQNEKKKRKRNKEERKLDSVDDFKVDSNDPRFAALFSHGNFNLDPSHPKYDPHSALNAIVAHNPKKKKKTDHHHQQQKQQQTVTKSHLDADVSSLIKKIKFKTSKPK